MKDGDAFGGGGRRKLVRKGCLRDAPELSGIRKTEVSVTRRRRGGRSNRVRVRERDEDREVIRGKRGGN